MIAGGLTLLMSCSSTNRSSTTPTVTPTPATPTPDRLAAPDRRLGNHRWTGEQRAHDHTTTTTPTTLAPVDFADPFTLGVASGDPDATSVVLWTRLAPDPTRADGGMPEADVDVAWEVSADESFADLIVTGTAVASARDAHSVHVVADLPSDGEHWYRWRLGQYTSPVGRTSRAPAQATTARFASASCQNYEAGFYAAHRDLVEQRPDFVVWLGDYIYEYAAGAAGAVRSHGTAEPTDLDGYRLRYARYKTDDDLQAAHRSCPWFVVWDDHEVQNDYAGLTPQDPAQAPSFADRRAAAYRAWWEHMPVRLAPPTQLASDPTAEYRIYRDAVWGGLLGMAMLDGRQYRSDQACAGQPAGLEPPCAEMGEPQRTMLGAAQEQWVGATFGTWGTTWNLLANQTVLTDLRVGGAVLNADQWDGYPAARERLLDQLGARSNVVVRHRRHPRRDRRPPGRPGRRAGHPVDQQHVACCRRRTSRSSSWCPPSSMRSSAIAATSCTPSA